MDWQAGSRQEGRQEHMQAVRRVDRQAGRQEGMQEGRNAGRQTDKDTGRQMYKYTYRQTEIKTCRHTQTDRRTVEKYRYRLKNGQMYRNTIIHTYSTYQQYCTTDRHRDRQTDRQDRKKI